MRSSDAGAQRAFVPAVAASAAFHAPFTRRFATPLTIFDAVDVTRAADSVTLSATRVIGDADPHLRAHFPEFTIFPGVFLIEALRQAVRMAIDDALDIAAVHSVRFTAPLLPGDVLHLAANVSLHGESSCEVVARVTRRDHAVAATMKVRFERPDAPAGDACVRARALLPHAHPMLLVDRIVSLEPGRGVTAIKAISATDPCYRALPRDAAPRSLAYPTSLLLESFGQTAALLWLDSATGDALGHDHLVILASARACRIHGEAYPGDVLTHRARLDKIVGDTLLAEGETWVGERRIATIESMIATVRPRAAMAERRENE